MRQKIGILGGVGPEATADLFKKIIKVTPAKKDQDHVETIVISNSHIPDRTQAILYNGESPVAEMLYTAKLLDTLGVSCIIIPCNTAHYFLGDVQKEITTPILNMIEETVQHIRAEYAGVKKVGILGTSGTIKSKIYELALLAAGIETVIPDEDVQENFVMEAIYGTKGIKAGYKKTPRTLLQYASLHLQEKGAQVIIQGCTEIPLVMTKRHCTQPQVDPTLVIAQKAVTFVSSEQVVISSDSSTAVSSFTGHD
jgi:aspartate racemase